jgi:hypothetical protein
LLPFTIKVFVKSISNKRVTSGIKNAVSTKYFYHRTHSIGLRRCNGRQVHDVSFDYYSFAGRGHTPYHFDINPGVLCMALDSEKMDKQNFYQSCL